MNSDTFYADLEAFDDFAEIANIEHYRVAPDDWHIIIADVKGSTRAIAEGRYKDINMIGAACINSVLNVTDKGRIPYVFGGDGATLAVPAHCLEACKQVLLGVRQLAAERFDLALRVGVVAVTEVHAASNDRVMVAKYRLSPGNVLAAFSGGGIELAERWIKADSAYLVEAPVEGYPDLSGLSCRWEPLQSQRGVMLSLLMQAGDVGDAEKAGLYRGLIEDLERLTRDGDNDVRPVCDANMKFRWPPRGLRREIDCTVGTRNRLLYSLGLYFYSAIQWALDRFDLTAGGYQGKRYRVELRSNTDYRRFDDTLRILLDCSPAQADEIEAMLEKRAQIDGLRYGLHRSEAALMTCLVFNLDKGEHIHFVDGNDGGFTAAASKLKAKAT